MPAESKAQFRWLFTKSAKKALGSAGVNEWKSTTGSPKDLPERKKSMLGGAVRRKNG